MRKMFWNCILLCTCNEETRKEEMEDDTMSSTEKAVLEF